MSATLHIVCPTCQAINRVREDQLASAPSCGRCKLALFLGKPTDLDATGFERHLKRNELPLLVDFWAPWCGPCRAMAPAYEQAAKLLEPRFRIAKVDTERAQEVSARLGIRSIPTLALFSGGREVARQPGALTKPEHIAQWARTHLPFRQPAHG